jgi:hypothetical protein
VNPTHAAEHPALKMIQKVSNPTTGQVGGGHPPIAHLTCTGEMRAKLLLDWRKKFPKITFDDIYPAYDLISSTS